MTRWYVKTTALSLLSVGLPMMALYAEGSATTMNDTISVFDFGSSPMVTERVVVLAGETESPMNHVSVAPTYPFFWRSPGVVPGVYRFVTSYDPPAFLPPEFRRPRTDSPIATSPVLLMVATRSTIIRIERGGAPLRMPGLLEKDVCSLAKLVESEETTSGSGGIHTTFRERLTGWLTEAILCQLGNVGDDGLDHPCQRLDLLGEIEECLGRNDKRLEVRYWRSESRVVKQSPVAIWCRRHRARLLRGKTRSLSGCLRGWWKDVGESVGVLRVWVTCWAFLRHRPSFQRQNIVEPFGVELRCRPDLVSAEYANLPTSIMIRISDFGWNRLSVVSALASVDLSVHSFCSTLES
ncbi:hypothetical protein GW17_00039557 [Ensete ventricosum]|nr:hypothetical protein GW17_00039557 [Ensete ventricosum]